MKSKLVYLKAWWKANARQIGKIIFVGLVGLIAVFLINQVKAQRDSVAIQAKQSSNQTKILTELAKQAKTRSDNVNKLIQDNAEQTLILCTIILRDSTTLTAEEKTSIEAICHEQITEISGGLSDASSSGTAAGIEQSGNQTSSPNSTSQGTTPQANNPQPTPVTPVVPVPTTPNCTIDILFIHVGKCN